MDHFPSVGWLSFRAMPPELGDVQLVEHLGDLAVDVLGAVVGVEAQHLEGAGLDELLEHRHETPLGDGPYRRHVLPLQHLVHEVDVVHALLAVFVPLVHRVHPQVARLPLRLGLASFPDPDRGRPRLLEAGAAPPVGGRLAQVVELAVRDGRQALEALVGVLLEHPPHDGARRVSAHLAQCRIDLGQKPDVGLRVAPPERVRRLAAAVANAAGLPVLPDQPRHLRLGFPDHLHQVAPDHALVAPRKRPVAELDQRLTDELVARSAVHQHEVHRLVAGQETADLDKTLKSACLERHNHPPMIPDPNGSRSPLVGLTTHAHAHFSLDSAIP